jgi:hypothetical protein
MKAKCIAVFVCLSSFVAAGGKLTKFPISIVSFNTETGSYDLHYFSKKDFRQTLDLWKRIKSTDPILSPDIPHGRECGSYKYLHASGIISSRLLRNYQVFLIRPGRRACDFDEHCKVDLEINSCAHTQFLINYPIIVDMSDTTTKSVDSIQDFNKLLRVENIDLTNCLVVNEVAGLWLVLSGELIKFWKAKQCVLIDRNDAEVKLIKTGYSSREKYTMLITKNGISKLSKEK